MSSFNNFERISLAMQANSALGDKFFVDAKLVGELVTRGHEWALAWEYDWLKKEPHPLDNEVEETTRIFDMYIHLQSSANNAVHRVEDTLFPGFDFNNDDHAGIAAILVEKLRSYTHLRGALSNSHSIMSISNYRKMLAAYSTLLTAMLASEGFRQLHVEEIDLILDC